MQPAKGRRCSSNGKLAPWGLLVLSYVGGSQIGAPLQLGYCFFQAEDGIRDLTVTGVQTCALPISATGGAKRPGGVARRCSRRSPASHRRRAGIHPPARRRGRAARRGGARGRGEFYVARSEERRVGEEGRSRWSPDY